MPILSHSVSSCDLTPEQNAELQAWLDAIDRGHFEDEAPELEDWSPDDEDREWWAAEKAHLESQRREMADGFPESAPALEEKIAAAADRLRGYLFSPGLAERIADRRL